MATKPLPEILTANLKRLMDEANPRKTQAQVATAGGMQQRTVGRIKNGDMVPTLIQLQALAKAFRLQPWQLLVPDLDPKSPPVLIMDQRQAEAIERLVRAAQGLVPAK